MKSKNICDCSSWNCCDKQLKSCIERSQFVTKTRQQLKEKKLRSKLAEV